MRKSLSILVAALYLAGCREQERPAQSTVPLDVPTTEYNRVLSTVAVRSYQAQPGDSTYNLLTSELRTATDFASLQWPYFALRSSVEIWGRESACRYNLVQILNVINGRSFTPTTPLGLRERVYFPDLNGDGRIGSLPAARVGTLQFVGLLDSRGMPVPSEFNYNGRTYKVR